MTIGGLFEGIGGFPLAATWAGIKPIWSNEIDPFCCKVLRKNFDHEIIEKDIREIGKHNLKPVDIITGGPPCQPASHAGKRKGTKDNRYLWDEMLRIIKELKPSYVIGENVTGLLSMENGKTLERILFDLENEGYQTETFIIPACAVGAWHRRDRIWIVAYDGSWNTWGGHESKQAKMRRFKSWQNSKTSSSFSGQDNSRGISKRKLETSKALENVPNTDSSGHLYRESKEQSTKRGRESQRQLEPSYTHEDVSNANNKGLQGWNSKELQKCTKQWITRKGNTQINEQIWESEPNVGRVATRLSTTLDETLNNYGYENGNNQEAFTKIDFFRREIMREMWSKKCKIKQTSLRAKGNLNNDFMYEMSCLRTQEGWKLGQRIKENEELCDMWNGILSKPFQKTQDLQFKMLERIREIERNEKVVSSRTDRLKGLGNAIVPQIAYELFKAIKESEFA